MLEKQAFARVAACRSNGRHLQAIGEVGLAVLLWATLAIPPAPASAHEPAHAPGEECLPGIQDELEPYDGFNRGGGTPILVTEDCIDPRYNTPVIDAIAFNAAPIPHIVVHARFADDNGLPDPPEVTPATFALYFPTEPGVYEGRFIVGAVHQLRLTGEVGLPDEVEEAADNGAYLMEFSPNADYALTAYDALGANAAGEPWGDPSHQYRLPSAAAKYSRELAQTIYGFEHRAYGYLYGGSGGAYMSISTAEQTIGVWDGLLPFVMGHVFATPNDYTFRFHSLRTLRQGDPNWPASEVEVWDGVVDAVDPGGSGDPYALLNAEEAAALRETSIGGFPLPGWYQHAGMGGSAFFLVAQYPPILDPSYTSEFWTLPGYLGADSDPGDSTIHDYRIVHPATVVAVSPPIPPVDYNALGPAYNSYMLSQYITGPPRTITFDSLPPETVGSGVLDGEASVEFADPDNPGQTVRIAIGISDRNTNTVTFAGGMPPHRVNQLEVGMDVVVSNDEFLALQTIQRHQIPFDPPAFGGLPGGDNLYGWDQFKFPDGTPRYPQRPPPFPGPVGNYNSAGTITSGHFHGPTKMIVMQAEMDLDAFPWCADWYAHEVRADQIAQGQDPEDNFRLWFTEHALHGGGGGAGTRTINYSSTLQQALLDLEGWRERGEVPPDDSVYDVIDGQVVLAPTAAQRRGVTPVVHLAANGSVRANIDVGGSVTFDTTIEVPPGSVDTVLGEVVAAEFDPDGDGGTAWGALSIAGQENQQTVTLQFAETYTTPGTYFPAVRGTSQRPTNPGGDGMVQDLDRVRVVVCDYANDPDSDGDGIPDACDTCPFVSDPGQEDSGGIGTSEPDGIGDACQCGDVTGNGVVNGQDGNAIRRHGLGIDPNPTFQVPGNCDVSGNDACNSQDGNAVRRAALGVGLAENPLFGMRCHNWTGEPVPPGL